MNTQQKIDLYKQIQQLNDEKELVEEDGIYTLGILEDQDVSDDLFVKSS